MLQLLVWFWLGLVAGKSQPHHQHWDRGKGEGRLIQTWSNLLRILSKQNTALLSSVCVSVCLSAGVTSHLFTFITCPRPYKPYIFWKLMTRPDQTRPDQTRPDQTRPDQRGYFTLYLGHFPNKFCFNSPTNCVVSPTILLQFPNNFASFPQQFASFPQQYESFPQLIFSFPQHKFVSFCQKIIICCLLFCPQFCLSNQFQSIFTLSCLWC